MISRGWFGLDSSINLMSGSTVLCCHLYSRPGTDLVWSLYSACKHLANHESHRRPWQGSRDVHDLDCFPLWISALGRHVHRWVLMCMFEIVLAKILSLRLISLLLFLFLIIIAAIVSITTFFINMFQMKWNVCRCRVDSFTLITLHQLQKLVCVVASF